MPKETAKESFATNGAFVIWLIVAPCNRNVSFLADGDRERSVTEALMWAIPGEEVDVLAEDVVKMAEAKAHEVVEALSFQRAYPRFGKSVRVRRPYRRLDDPRAHITKQLIECRSELGVAIA
jgi:hypothetical protein